MADETIITPSDNGPLHVRGQFKLVMPSGRELDTDGEAWLCRCGGSQNKPFCDGTHSKLGFAAAEAAVAAFAASADGPAFQDVGADAEVGDGQLIGVEVDGQPLVVGRVDGQLHAIGGLCSHGGARLEDGDLVGNLVLCPRHGGAVDIRSGAPARLPVAAPVPRYEVDMVDGRILVSRAPATEPAARR
jgi:CDGSH iron-sulfur domain-containing protein 3